MCRTRRECSWIHNQDFGQYVNLALTVRDVQSTENGPNYLLQEAQGRIFQSSPERIANHFPYGSLFHRSRADRGRAEPIRVGTPEFVELRKSLQSVFAQDRYSSVPASYDELTLHFANLAVEGAGAHNGPWANASHYGQGLVYRTIRRGDVIAYLDRKTGKSVRMFCLGRLAACAQRTVDESPD